MILHEASTPLVETLRTGVARMIVAVANASGRGSSAAREDQRRGTELHRMLNAELGLDRTEAGAWLMKRWGA